MEECSSAGHPAVPSGSPLPRAVGRRRAVGTRAPRVSRTLSAWQLSPSLARFAAGEATSANSRGDEIDLLRGFLAIGAAQGMLFWGLVTAKAGTQDQPVSGRGGGHAILWEWQG